MLFRRSFVGALALTAAGPVLAHGPGHSMGGGKPGEAGKETRVIEVVATDNAFSLKSLQVNDGETVRFVVRNDGLDPHEFLIGTESEHAEHRQMMRAMMQQQRMNTPSVAAQRGAQPSVQPAPAAGTAGRCG